LVGKRFVGALPQAGFNDQRRAYPDIGSLI
jgi:hypothetical protein